MLYEATDAPAREDALLRNKGVCQGLHLRDRIVQFLYRIVTVEAELVSRLLNPCVKGPPVTPEADREHVVVLRRVTKKETALRPEIEM